MASQLGNRALATVVLRGVPYVVEQIYPGSPNRLRVALIPARWTSWLRVTRRLDRAKPLHEVNTPGRYANSIYPLPEATLLRALNPATSGWLEVSDGAVANTGA